MAPAISVIVPVLNEQDNIYPFFERVNAVLQTLSLTYEIIFVDDGSNDGTFFAIQKLARETNAVKYISFSRNFGHQVALFAGMEKCSGENIILIDGDMQDPPELIDALVNEMNKGFDVVYAKRVSRNGESFLKKITAKFFYRLMSRITTINIPLDTGDFRIMKRKVCQELLMMKEHNKFLRGQIAWLGFKESSISFERDERKFGNSNFTYRKMIQLALDGITGFSKFPLKFASLSGILFSFAAFIFIIYVMLAKLFWGHTISGWASLMVTILFLGGIQLLSIGIIGEYVSRINDNVRNRQQYIVKETNLP